MSTTTCPCGSSGHTYCNWAGEKKPTVPRERVRVIEMDGPAPDARDPDVGLDAPLEECQVWGERGDLSLVCYRPAGHIPPVHWDARKELAWYDVEWDRPYRHPFLPQHEHRKALG